MPLHPQVKAYLERVAAARPDGNTLTPAQARADTGSVQRAQGPDVARVEDRTIPVQGGSIPVRIYWPKGQGPFPALVWLHGGGWVGGDIALADGAARHIAGMASCVVVSVGYRLAPEHKFPVPAEDCYAAAKWTYEIAKALNADGKRLAIGGSSAGGNLAAAVALMARDRKGPPLVHQALVYPVIERNLESASYRENGEGLFLTKAMMKFFWKQYVRTDADAEHPYAAPIKAKDLRGLPPALVQTAEYDPLRDEGEAYAKALKKVGIPTKLTRYNGMIHGFVSMWSEIDAGRDALAEVARELKKRFR
jgi:acetyl esterase